MVSTVQRKIKQDKRKDKRGKKVTLETLEDHNQFYGHQ